MIITVLMKYGQSAEIHAWLDDRYPNWNYLGSQFHIPKDFHQVMSFDECKALYREQREGWGRHYPKQSVTQHFELGTDPSDTEIVLMKMEWDIIVMTNSATREIVGCSTGYENFVWF